MTNSSISWCPAGHYSQEVADWLKEQVEETELAIVVLGLQRCLEVLKQNEQLRRRSGATFRVGAFRWEDKDDRTTYRAFLRAVQKRLPECVMPDLEMAFRMHYGSLSPHRLHHESHSGRRRIARCQPRREITLRTFAQSSREHVWIERVADPNPFVENFEVGKAPPLKLPSERASPAPMYACRSSVGLELHA